MRTNEFFANSEKNGSRVIKSYQEKHSEVKKRGRPRTGNGEGAMNNSDMDTRDDITPARCYHPPP